MSIKGREDLQYIQKIQGYKVSTLCIPVSLNPNSEYESELACKVEFYILEVHLSHLQNISAIRQEDIPPLTVFRHILILTLLECFQFFKIIALYPASLIKAQRLPTALRTIFILQAILDNLKLQLPYRTDNLPAVELVDKQLCHTFVHQLIDTFGKLFLFHRIGQHSRYT